MRRRVIFLTLVLLGVLGFGPGQVSAQSTTADAIDIIVDEIESTGRFVDPAALPLGDGVDAAIDRANAAGIAVVLPEPATDAEALAPAIDEAMQSVESRFDAVFVLTPAMIAAEVGGVSEAELGAALDAAFVNADDATAIDAFVTSLTGNARPDAAASDDTPPSDDTPASSDSPSSNDTTGGGAADSDDSGGGVPWLAIVLLAIVAFFGLRFFTNRRKRRAAEAAAIEVDRAEIAEQLRNNADRVIDLGDPVIATADAELIALYEEASRTYQEVSLALPDATTAGEIDALDDRIDRAEWQLEVIAARLAGTPEPPSPEARAQAEAAAPDPHEPALGPDESVFDRRRDPSSLPRSTTRRRSSGGGLGGSMGGGSMGGGSMGGGSMGGGSMGGGSMGGGMGGMLGSILGQILLGGGRPRTTSRRTQRRTPSSGSGGSLGPFGASGGSFPDPFSRTRRSSGSSGGRSRTTRAGGSRTRRTSTRRSGGSRRR